MGRLRLGLALMLLGLALFLLSYAPWWH